jgi:hypothetical protein
LSTLESVGESNTASNTGSAGTGIYKQKTDVDLELYKLNSTSDILTIELDGTDKIDFTIVEGSIDHNNLTNAHNLTTDIDHNSLTNTHNLTTDIDHNSLTNYASNRHFLQTDITNLYTDLGTGLLKIATGSGALSTIGDSSTNWNSAYTHISNSGVDHSYIDQDMTTGSSPSWYGQVKLGKVSINNEAHFGVEDDNGNSGAAKTIDWGNGNKQKITLTDNCDLTFTNPSGSSNLILKVIQDGTGSRTVTWDADVLWPSGTAPTLTTDADAIDIIAFYFDGTNYFGQSSLDFS